MNKEIKALLAKLEALQAIPDTERDDSYEASLNEATANLEHAMNEHRRGELLASARRATETPTELPLQQNTQGQAVIRSGNQHLVNLAHLDPESNTGRILHTAAQGSYTQDVLAYLASGGSRVSDSMRQVANLAAGGFNINADDEAAGGFFLPTDWQNEIIMRTAESSDILSNVRTIGTTAREVGWMGLVYDGDVSGRDPNGTKFVSPLRKQWTGMADTDDEDDVPQVGALRWLPRRIKVHGWKVKVRVPRTTLEDVPTLINILMTQLSVAMAQDDEYWHLRGGDGENSPMAITTTTGPVQLGSHILGNDYSTDEYADNLRKARYKIGRPYRNRNFAFYGSDAWMENLATVKNTAGEYIWGTRTKDEGTLTNEPLEILLGRPFRLSPFFDEPVAVPNGEIVGMMGDLAATYTRVVRMDMSVEVDARPGREYVDYYFRGRSGGGLLTNWAMKLLVEDDIP